jgi:hypothetical protein
LKDRVETCVVGCTVILVFFLDSLLEMVLIHTGDLEWCSAWTELSDY